MKSSSFVKRAFRIGSVTVTAGLVGAVFLACESRDPFVTFGSGVNDAAPPPSFVETDAGASDATVEPESSVLAPMCAMSECPAPFGTCASYAGTLMPYACATNLSNDADNCGECGKKCLSGSSAFHFRRACVNGTCQPACEQGYADCNGIPDDGCESDPKIDSANCGVCGNACPAGVACVEGKCGCPSGQIACNGACVDPATNDDNCGSCDFRCADNQPADAGTPPAHMFYGCAKGKCEQLRCIANDSEFWADCNGNQADGCEVDLVQPHQDNCGSCGNACAAGKQCFRTSDTGMACQCSGNKVICPGPSCADLENDAMNCGSCGYVCPQIDFADITCAKGRCGYACKPGFADCNGLPEDGCEVDLNRDPRSCGACGNSCDLGIGQPCVAGKCAARECDAGVVK